MLPIGLVINNRYRIEGFLGQGGMASVYLISHVVMHRQFALKIITVERACSLAFRELFQQEAQILAALRHPHLVEIIDFDWTQDGQPYLVMELLQGESLGQFLRRAGPLAPPVALQISLQICDALQAAHDRSIAHLDLTPSNIFLCENESHPNFVKVLDFGIARIASVPEPSAPPRARLLGTPAYMAPEQAARGESPPDGRADQFALGAILYEMLSDRSAFGSAGKTTQRVLESVVREDPLPLADTELDALVRRALSKEPAARFASIQDFAAALADTAPGRAAAARGQAVWTEPGRPGRMRTGLPVPPPGSAPIPPQTISQHGEVELPRAVQNRSASALLLVGVGVLALGGLLGYRFLPALRTPGAVIPDASQPPDLASPILDAALAATPDLCTDDRALADLASPPSPPDLSRPHREPRRPIKPTGIRVTLIGVTDGPVAETQRDYIKTCAERYLLPAAAEIKVRPVHLRRTGELQVDTDLPVAIGFAFDSCLLGVPRTGKLPVAATVYFTSHP